MAVKYFHDALKIHRGNELIRAEISNIMKKENCSPDVLSACQMALLNDDIEVQKCGSIKKFSISQAAGLILPGEERQNLLRLISPRSEKRVI